MKYLMILVLTLVPVTSFSTPFVPHQTQLASDTHRGGNGFKKQDLTIEVENLS
jgi:hypothetical protein